MCLMSEVCFPFVDVQVYIYCCKIKSSPCVCRGRPPKRVASKITDMALRDAVLVALKPGPGGGWERA